eukprot:scaffold4102_cov71-Phaeocystis_antarctica.AAC.2
MPHQHCDRHRLGVALGVRGCGARPCSHRARADARRRLDSAGGGGARAGGADRLWRIPHVALAGTPDECWT